jgi:hypothetical protein
VPGEKVHQVRVCSAHPLAAVRIAAERVGISPLAMLVRAVVSPQASHALPLLTRNRNVGGKARVCVRKRLEVYFQERYRFRGLRRSGEAW